MGILVYGGRYSLFFLLDSQFLLINPKFRLLTLCVSAPLRENKNIHRFSRIE